MTAKPELIAHRGYPRHFPENSIAGIEAAIRAGARHVEVDVQLTTDGIPVLFHDRTLDRVCGVTGSIAGLSLRALASLSASEPSRFGDTFAGTRIATLAELARLMRTQPQVHFFIEVKRISIEHHGAERVLEAVQRTLKGMEHQCTLISFAADILPAAGRRGWHTGLILESWDQLPNSIQELAPDLPEYLFCDVECLPKSGRLHIPDVRLAVYEIDEANQALALAARGVELVETFSIAEMKAALAKR